MVVLNSRERVLTALDLKIPDRIPYCELEVDEVFSNNLLGINEKAKPQAGMNRPIEKEKRISKALGKDNVIYFFSAPTFCEEGEGKDNRTFYVDGVIKTKNDLKKVILPNPNRKSLYYEAIDFVKGKEDFAACVVTNLGIDPVIKSIGSITFLYALHDNVSLIEDLLSLYVDWEKVVLRNLQNIGFDVIWAADDFAYNTGLLFSPEVFRKVVLPQIKETADCIELPWIYHTDGNIWEIVEELLDLGMNGLHPIDPNSMDIFEFKRVYGKRICLVGNLDVNLLSGNNNEEIISGTTKLINEIGKDGGYIFSSGNSITSYCKVENVLLMSDILRRKGIYDKQR